MEEVRQASNVRLSRLVEWLGLFLPDLDLDKDRLGTARALGEADDMVGLARHLGLQPAAPARLEGGASAIMGLRPLTFKRGWIGWRPPCAPRSAPSEPQRFGWSHAGCPAVRGRRRARLPLPSSTVHAWGEKALRPSQNRLPTAEARLPLRPSVGDVPLYGCGESNAPRRSVQHRRAA